MRNDQTIPIPPPRRPAYPPAPTRGAPGQPVQPGDDTFSPNVDWSLWRGLQAVQEHARQRSNPKGDGIDSIAANSGGEVLTVTLPAGYAGAEIRVPHNLKRVPSAVVHMRTDDPNFSITGNPAGTTGTFSNSPWTAKEVFLVSNGTAGTVFQIVVS